ncbi:response regulator [Nocardioides anomalus]|uniref:Circadian input-output histidine kinase CikA n=1 Tax=Nocardioides anomalus TaxID=2712223 RepID=A0A6G6WFZ3_9ACTN|nr:PAS domain-containing hybrid sensor histidine kinase/response regulator [Nocardioides anomalus]QIG44129.1 response regulator [Nocardioides anomalus]
MSRSVGSNPFLPTALDPADLLGAIADGLWMFDDDGRTTFANAQMARMLGRELDEMPGFSVFEALDEQGRADFRRHLDERRTRTASAQDLPCLLVRRDGTTRWALVSHHPVLVDGEPRGWLYRAKDNGEQRRLVEELRRRHAQFAELQQLAHIGSWERDLSSDEVVWSEETYRLCRVDPATFSPNSDTFMALLNPTDALVLAEKYAAMLAGGPPLDDEARLVDEHGEVTWLRVRGVMSRDSEGRPVRVGGTLQDVTEAKRAAEGQQFLAELSGAANQAESLTELFFSVDRNIRLHSGWRALLASGPHHRDPSRPFFAPMQDAMSPELTAIAEELAQAVFDTHRPATARSPHGTVLLGGPALVDGDLACTIVSDTGSPNPPSPSDLALYDQMLHHLAHVAERAQAAEELAAARDDALQASRAKSEFLATMSHEIRTPLNGVIGLSELMRHTDLSPEQARLASGIDQAGRSLLALVNDILDLSKIEAGRLDLEEVDFELRPVLAQSIGLVVDQAREKGLDLDVRVEPGVPLVVRGDPVRLGQVVTNLASNAVKFTAEGGIAVHVDWVDGLLRVDVEDTGIGVRPEQAERLFEPFAQADSSTTRTYGGTGLGLAISSRIVAATGGRIGVDTSRPVGSTFWFTMRLAASTVPPVPPELAVQRASADDERPAAGRVLVVEDNAINQLVAEGMLRRLGYDVTLAGNGSAAVAWVAAEPDRFDAILMDCQMPVMDGFDATRAIRAQEDDGRHTPIIAMTAAALTEEREQCFAAGMDDFLTKPVDPARLEATLARWVPRPSVAEPADRDHVASRLGELRAMGLEPALLVQLVGAYDDVVRDSLVAVRDAVRVADHAEVARQAHALRGAASNLGLAGLVELCRAVEAAAGAGELPTPAAVDTLAGAATEGAALLREFLVSVAP